LPKGLLLMAVSGAYDFSKMLHNCTSGRIILSRLRRIASWACT